MLELRDCRRVKKAANTKENETRLAGEINAYTNVLNMIETFEENK